MGCGTAGGRASEKLVAESLGEEDGVMLIDESSIVKQGEDSVGVVAQYCWLGGQDCEWWGQNVLGLFKRQGL